MAGLALGKFLPVVFPSKLIERKYVEKIMNITRKKLVYIAYCIIIFSSFVQSIDISPYIAKFVFNKIFYISTIVCLALSIKYQKIKMPKKIHVPMMLLMAFAFFYALANFYHKEPGWIASAIGNGVFYFITFVTIYLVSREFSLERLISPFLVISIILILVSLAIMAGLPLQYYHSDENVVDYHIAAKLGLTLTRLSGVYLNQNAFAVLAFIGSAVFLMKYQLEKKHQKSKARYFYIAMLIVTLLCVLMTLSRAGILACLILLFLYFSKTAATKRGLVLFFFVGVFLFFVMNAFDEYTEALIYRVENDGTSSRMELWVDAINTFKENYWLGAGEYRYYTPNGHLTSHNIYIQLLASQGVFAFICWFGFILSFLLSALKNILKVNIGINPIIVISSMAFVSILVHQVFETMILGSGGPLVVFMFFLMSAIKFTSPPAPLEISKNA